MKHADARGVAVVALIGFPGGNAGASLKREGNPDMTHHTDAVSPAGMPGPH